MKPGATWGRLIAFSVKFMRSEPIRWEIRASPGERREKIGEKRGGRREKRLGQVEDRGKSITACFNTWNACDFEVDKGKPGTSTGMLSTVFRRYVPRIRDFADGLLM